MSNIRIITLFAFFTLIFSSTCLAQKATFSGKLVKKPWTKSIESYCAGGSDYYVLKAGKEATILDFSNTGLSEEEIAKFENQKVKVKGVLKTVNKEESNDNMSQHPQGGVACTKIEVSSIKQHKKK